MITATRRLLPFFCGLLLGALVTYFLKLSIKTGSIKLAASMTAIDAGMAAVPGDKSGALMREYSEPCPSALTPRDTKAVDIPGTLYKAVRILCLIMTHPGNYKTKAVAVNNTWAPRCNRYAFIGTNDTPVDIPVIRLNISEVYTNLWQKVWMSLDYAEKKFDLEKFDYVLKADDDTYVVLENLRLLLLPLDPNEPILLGREFIYAHDERQRYMSGGAGYVLSRAAVKLFLQRTVRIRGREIKSCDLERRVSEDWMLGTCMTSLGVKLVKSLDSNGLERFHPLNPEYMIGQGTMPSWLWTFNYYKFRACLRNCISPVTSTFHYISNMYLVEFLLYGMRPIGVDPTANEAIELRKVL